MSSSNGNANGYGQKGTRWKTGPGKEANFVRCIEGLFIHNVIQISCLEKIICLPYPLFTKTIEYITIDFWIIKVELVYHRGATWGSNFVGRNVKTHISVCILINIFTIGLHWSFLDFNKLLTSKKELQSWQITPSYGHKETKRRALKNIADREMPRVCPIQCLGQK